MVAGEDFECPECGSSFAEGTPACPGCGAALEWGDEEGEVAEEAGPEEALSTGGEERQTSGHDIPLRPAEGAVKVMSPRGILFSTLTLAGLVATLLLLRWDTWVHGEAVESIGDDQRMLIYVAAIGTMAFSVLTIVDILWTSSVVGPAGGSD